MTDPFTADSNGKRPIIEALIGVLSSRKHDPLDRVEYLLRNCGYLAERKGDCVVLSDNAHWLDFRDLDVADLLYQERIRLREIRREIALQMDARAEQFAFESILLNMDLLLQQVS